MDGSLVNGNNNINEDFNDDWRTKVIITFLHKGHCQYFHFICLCSCSFGIIWCMLFAKCASGMYVRLTIPQFFEQLIYSSIILIIHSKIWSSMADTTASFNISNYFYNCNLSIRL